MITTSEIAPTLALRPFIHCYAYREFDTNGSDITMPWRASHESNIIFFFEDVPKSLTEALTGKVLKRGQRCDVVGMATRFNGTMAFNGKYRFLQIIFQPGGFFTIFHISPAEIADSIVWSEDIFSQDIKFLHEQLYDAENLTEMVRLTDSWLLKYLRMHKVDYKNAIVITANLILFNPGSANIDDLSHFACMSQRNFERHFFFEIGMSPKQLCCITRFNKALDLKRSYPELKWTSIAHQFGYFDQMHLIKDFKRFCGEAPSSLLKHSPLFEEKYIERVGP